MKNILFLFIIFLANTLIHKPTWASNQNYRTLFFGHSNGQFLPTSESRNNAKLFFHYLNIEQSQGSSFTTRVKQIKEGGSMLFCIDDHHTSCTIIEKVDNLNKISKNSVELKGKLAHIIYYYMNAIPETDGAKSVANVSCKQYSKDSYSCILQDVVIR